MALATGPAATQEWRTPRLSLNATPTEVAAGGSATLTWSSRRVRECTASGDWSGARPTSGSQSVGPLNASATYTLTCSGWRGTVVSQTVKVSVTATQPPAQPPTVSLSATPGSVNAGSTVTLAWSASNATNCNASGAWSGAKATAGAQTSDPLSANSTFTLTCSGASGSASQSASVIVTQASAAPTINLAASPSSVTAGGASTLSWNTTDATSCTASGAWSGTKALSGSQSTGALSAASTYTLSCTGAGGTSARSVSVAVQSSNTGGQRRFQLVTVDGAGVAPYGKAMADIDGDGQLDIVVADGSGSFSSRLYWYRYPNWERYEIATAGAAADDIQIADINGDGAPDIVVNGNVGWFENPRGRGGDPRGAWTRRTIDSAGAHDLVLADINGDGKIDIATRKSFAQPTAIYLQGATPNDWTKVILGNASEGLGLAIADIDGDGRKDVIGNGYWLKQPADPVNGTWSRYDFGGWPAGASVEVADMNGDGRLDVIIAASEVGEGELAWFEAPADPRNGNWTKRVIGLVTDVHRFFVRDVNGDGRPDIVFAEMHQSPQKRIGVYYNNGNGLWTLQVIASTGAHNIAVGDVDGDGDIDIMGANWNTASPDGGTVNLWRNVGAQ